jgi:exosortase
VAFTFCGGWAVWRWIWPSFGFLLFALPLPSTFEHEFSWYLQSVAVKASTFLFQLLGFAAYQPPNQMLVVLGSTRLEVERTCAGLSMLLTFVSLAGAIAFLIPNRVRVDRILILASAVPIAVICNIGRIVITGLVYHAGWTWLGDLIVHELAGWLMMPAALGLIWLELRFIDWILIPQDDASLDEVARASRRAPLFLMPQPEGRSRAEFPPPSLTPPPVASIEVDRLPQPRSGVGS